MDFTGALKFGYFLHSLKWGYQDALEWLWLTATGLRGCFKRNSYYLILVPRQHLCCKDRFTLMNVTTTVRLKLKLKSSFEGIILRLPHCKGLLVIADSWAVCLLITFLVTLSGGSQQSL